MTATSAGAPIPRKTDARLLRGDGHYVGDIAAPDMLTACVVRSVLPHGRILSIDTTEARALPGVAAVYTAGDLGSAQRPIATWDDNTALRLDVHFGDVSEAFRRAAYVVEERFSSQRYTGVPLEGRGLLVVPGKGPDELTVWTSHETPHFQRATICEALDIPELGVRVAQADVGGGFGQKAGLYPEDVLVPFAAHRLRRPVHWLEDRREHFVASSHSRE